MIWIELSHTMQWFVSWGIFTWLGKVSYGFYLMQFLTIYGLAPHLVIYFHNQGRSYWDNLIPTFIICLIFNIFIAWVAYHLVDRVGLHVGKWVWDGLFVSKPNNAGSLPLKMLKSLGRVFVFGPGKVARSTGSNVSKKYHGFVDG